MKFIKFKNTIITALLLGSSILSAYGASRVESDSLVFRRIGAKPLQTFSGRSDFSDIQLSSKISVVMPEGAYFQSSGNKLTQGGYAIVHNTNSDLSDRYNWFEDQVDGSRNVLCFSKTADGKLPYIELTNLVPGREYQFSFTILNPAASWSECKPQNADFIGIHTQLINPRTNDGTGITPTRAVKIYNYNRDNLHEYEEATRAVECASREQITNGKRIKHVFSFRTAEGVTSARLLISEHEGYGYLGECSAVGLMHLSLSSETSLDLSVSATLVCEGKSITLTAKTTQNVSKFSWYRKYRNEAGFSKFTIDTEEPTVTDMPTDTAQYYVVADGVKTDEITVNVAEQCLYITPRYSSDLCSDDTNTLFASGYVVLDDIESKEFVWEEYDESTASWVKLSSNTMKQKVKTEKTTRYRVTFKGATAEYVHTVAPCASLVCDKLETKTVFLETFGFFVDATTYVDTKEEVRRGSVDVPSSGVQKIERYWAPDPYDYVVPPTEFTQAVSSFSNEPIVFDGDNAMCGTNGHQFANIDIRNPHPESDKEARRNGGYTWCNNSSSPIGNYRIEDGFYALVRNPAEADCGNGDFWNTKDHTGNTNGAMLMVNCGPTKAPIYAQRVSVGCPNLLLNFSAYLANAITPLDKEGNKKKDGNGNEAVLTPVQVTFKIYDKNMNLLSSLDSDPIEVSDNFTWTQQAMQFKSKDETDLIVQLVNNGESGYGNDILLDDISFTICLPKVILITDGMDIDNPEVVHICNDTTIKLYAKQKQEILENPLFRFQYKGEDNVWRDIDPTRTDFSLDNITISSSDSRFWGEVEYRVVAAENEEVLRKVVDGLQLSSCDLYATANSSLTIDNRYHGPMSPDEKISVCKGDQIVMKGSRECDKEGKWLNDWEWEWQDASEQPIPGYYKNKDQAKKNLAYEVKALSEVFYFVAYDSVCVYKQKFSLTGKNTAKISVDASAGEACDSLVLRRGTLEMETSDPAYIPQISWVVDGNEVIGDSVVIKPSVVPAEGMVEINIVSDDYYCSLENPIKLPYHIYAGNSLEVSLSSGGITRLCLDPETENSITLQANVTPAAAAKDIKYYLWYLNGAPLDTTTTSSLKISTDPSNKHHGLLVPGARLNFEVRVADGVCYTLDNPSAPGSVYIEVNEKYEIKLEAYPNDSICLTDLQSDTILVLTAKATSIYDPDHDVQSNIKTYVWSVDGTLFATTNTNKFVLLKSDHPAVLDKYLQAGTSPHFTVAAVDSICFENAGNAPSDGIRIVFNEAYSMKVSPDSKTVCVPETAVDENQILLELTVTTTPAAAQVHVQEYMWYLNGNHYRDTKEAYLRLSYKDLKDLVGQQVKFTVKSYDGICSDKNNPADNSNDVNIDIRSGGYILSLDVNTDKLCIDTLNPENNKLILIANVLPSSAKTSIDKFYWMDNGADIAETVDTFCVLTQATHPNLFVAGKTAVFNVKTFDALCAGDWVYGVGEGEKVYINESYKMELIADGDSLCFENENSAVLHLEAKVTPAPAANHIKEYKWYRDGQLLTSTTENKLEVTNAKFPGSLVPGAAHAFSVSSYDGICYTVEQPSESPAKPIVVGFKYDLKLEHRGKDSICLGTDSVVLMAKVYPAASQASVQTYIWSMELDGVETVIATTYAPEDSLVISQENFPSLFTAGTAPTFRVKSVDGICYTIDNPNVSDNFVIHFNTPYNMKLKSSSEVVCYSTEDGDDAEFTLTAVVTPAEAATYVKWYRWYQDGKLIDSTEANTLTIKKSTHPNVLVPGLNSTFTVDSYDDFCYTAEDPALSDSVDILINEKYKMQLEVDGDALCMETDFLILRAKVSPEAAKANIQKYFWKVNGLLFETTTGDVDNIKLSYSNEKYKEMLNGFRGTSANFTVESVDGICYTVDNPAKSEPVGIAIGGRFKIELDAPSDSICYDGPSAVSLTLKAVVDPASSAGLIKYYRWYKNGALIDSTRENYITITEDRYPGLIIAGENPWFSVDAYDNVCYTSENPAKSASQRIVINFKFRIDLDNGGKDYLCVGTDSLVVRALVTPAEAARNIKRYYWTKDGVPFDTTTVNQIVLSKENYPALFQGSTIPKFGVLAVDDICYTDDDPATSADISIKVNKVFDLKMEPNKDAICASGANSTVLLTAIVDPSESQNMIERYVWHKINVTTGVSEQIGEPTSIPYKEVSNLDHGEYAFYVTAYDGICFSVNPATSDSVNISVHENIFISLSADRLRYCTESSSLTSTPITLTAKVTQGTPNKYEVFDKEGSLFAMSSSEKTITFTVYPTLDNHEYVVRAYDGVCNNNDATAATTGNPLEISVFEPIELEVKADKELLCLGDSVRLSLTLKKGNPIQYEWSAVSYGGRNISITTNKKDSVIVDIPTEAGYQAYSLMASDGVCDDRIVSVSNVLVKENIVMTLRSDIDKVIIGGSVNFLADVTSGEPVLFTWKADDRVVATTKENTLFEYPKSPSVYTVEATDSVCSTVTSQIDMKVQLPTAFTPYDKDGYNDIFMETFKVTIFNRFGQVLFEGENGWDGSTYSNVANPNQVRQSCGTMADPGVYFYSVILKDGKEVKGTIEVVKM